MFGRAKSDKCIVKGENIQYLDVNPSWSQIVVVLFQKKMFTFLIHSIAGLGEWFDRRLCSGPRNMSVA